MSERGQSVLELLVCVGLVLVTAAVGVPFVRAYSEEARVLGAGRAFMGEFLRVRSLATGRDRNAAIRFERQDDGSYVYTTYGDGNGNGVLSSEIRAGIDPRLAGPFRVEEGAPGVRIAILPGVQAIPPEAGPLDPADPVRFGSSDMLSFSPLGTATPGTFYLASEGVQAAVRVTPGSARVRLLLYRSGGWVVR